MKSNKVDETLKTMTWNQDDIESFGIGDDQVDQLVFNDETRPFRLYDLSHELKNLPSKIHQKGWSYHITHIT